MSRPPLRPIRTIGRVENDNVIANMEFVRWVEGLNRDVATAETEIGGIDLTGINSTLASHTSSINSLTTAVSGHTTSIGTNTTDIGTNASDIAALAAVANFRATLTPKAVANATWEAVTPGTITSMALADYGAPTLTMAAGDYDIVFTAAFTGPSNIDIGVTYNGGSSWTTLATSATSPETVTGVTLSANAQFGFYCNTGSGTLDSGSIVITRA